ncbi:hypothetical protein ACU686_12590 [Yinghuangia aomiensis]
MSEKAYPDRGRQTRLAPVRPARQQDLDPGPPTPGTRARAPADRPGVRPLRHLRRTEQRPGRRPRLPVPVPLHRLRPLPHRTRHSLPELRTHLDTLLRDRERLAAATELDDWARTEATPSDEEIKRIRTLIRRVETDLDGLTDDEREDIKTATVTLRKSRTVSLGIPWIRPLRAGPAAGAQRVSGSSDHLARARAADSDRRRDRVLKALDRFAATGQESTSPRWPAPLGSTAA